MQSRSVPSFFLANNAGAAQGDMLLRMKPNFINSANCLCNSSRSTGAIRYMGSAICEAPGRMSILNSISLCGGNPGNSSGKTSVYSCTIRGKIIGCSLDSSCHTLAMSASKGSILLVESVSVELQHISLGSIESH